MCEYINKYTHKEKSLKGIHQNITSVCWDYECMDFLFYAFESATNNH